MFDVLKHWAEHPSSSVSHGDPYSSPQLESSSALYAASALSTWKWLDTSTWGEFLLVLFPPVVTDCPSSASGCTECLLPFPYFVINCQFSSLFSILSCSFETNSFSSCVRGGAAHIWLCKDSHASLMLYKVNHCPSRSEIFSSNTAINLHFIHLKSLSSDKKQNMHSPCRLQ